MFRVAKGRVKTISKLAFPVSVALSSTLVQSLISFAMVGRLGNSTIAAVGLALVSNALALACVTGLMPAVQGLVARGTGEVTTESKLSSLSAGLWVALFMGVPLTIVGYLSSGPFFALLSSDGEVARIGALLFKVLSMAFVAAAMNYAFEGYWLGVGKPQVHMLIVFCTGFVNILLNYVLIFGKFGVPPLGALGAAVNLIVCVHIGVIVNCALICFRYNGSRLLRAIPERSLVQGVLKLALPATFQEFYVEAGYLAFFWMLGRVGMAELAVGNVVVRIMMVFSFTSMSLGSASATLVSKAVGAGDLTGAAEWAWDTAKLGVVGVTLLGLPLFMFPRVFLSLFLSDPQTVSLGVIPLRLVGATAGIDTLAYIFSYTLYCVGDGNRVMLVLFCTTWILFLPGVWMVGPYLHYGLSQIMLVGVGSGVVGAAFVTSFWVSGRWKTIRI